MHLIWYWDKEIKFIECWIDNGFKAAFFSAFGWVFVITWVAIYLVLVTCTALMTLQERRFLSALQSRRGPSKAAIFGIFQPFADAVKLILKEHVIPRISVQGVWALVAVFSFFVSTIIWNFALLSYYTVIYSTELSIFFFILISLFHIYTILFAGWASKSRYAWLGALRTAAQLIAYDIVIALVYLNLYIFVKDFGLHGFVEINAQITSMYIFLPVQVIIFFVASLAETNRHPFDLPEAEAELVAGYNVEYGSMRFAMFFLAEYGSLLFLAITLNTIFFDNFCNGVGIDGLIMWCCKIGIIIYLLVLVRGLVPRYRYDQLMEVGWKFLIPIQCGFLFIGLIINIFN